MAGAYDDRDGVIWLDGAFVPWREAKVHVLSHALHYASSVFEGERAYGGVIFKSREHTDRLLKSCDYLDIPHPRPAEEIEAFVYGMAGHIVANAPLSITVMKEELRLLTSARAMSPELFERIQGLRRTVYDSRDYQEGLDAFREKRKPSFRGV